MVVLLQKQKLGALLALFPFINQNERKAFVPSLHDFKQTILHCEFINKHLSFYHLSLRSHSHENYSWLAFKKVRKLLAPEETTSLKKLMSTSYLVCQIGTSRKLQMHKKPQHLGNRSFIQSIVQDCQVKENEWIFFSISSRTLLLVQVLPFTIKKEQQSRLYNI